MNGRLLNKKLHNQLGFTLLELLVVIAVIGVLASLAVPRLQSQVQRARFVDVINSTAPYKAGVEMCFQRMGGLATCTAGQIDIPANNQLVNGNVGGQVVGAAGVITATGTAASGNGAAQPLTYILVPAAAAGGLTWTANTGTCTAANFC